MSNELRDAASEPPVFRISDHHLVRSVDPADAEELFRLTDANRAYLRRWLPWLDNATSVDDTRRHIENRLQQYAHHNGMDCVICYDGQIVGNITFHLIDWQNRSTSIGYWLAEPFQGRGLMTVSCAAFVRHAFAGWNMNRVVIRCATRATSSRAIPQRLGFTREGVLRQAEWLYDRFVDLEYYALLQRHWEAAQRLKGI